MTKEKTKKVIAIPISVGVYGASLTDIYVNYIIEAGYTPLLIYPYDLDSIEKICDISDGLMLAGGIDIDPTHYGYDNKSARRCDPDRDDAHRDVIGEFLKQKKPIFGICRGMQLIMLEYLAVNKSKCKFKQHIEDHNPVHDRELMRSTTTHSVMFKALGEKKHKKVFVNSMHHQGFITNDLKGLSKELDVIAYTDFGLVNADQYVIEGVYFDDLGGSRIMGVQWHPEELRDYKLLQDFFN